MNWGEEPPTADPALAVDRASINLTGSLFVGLTQVDEETSAILLDLALSWDVSADGTVYTFHLRDDVERTDGKPVTAQDAEYGILRMLDPETASEYAYALASIVKGAADYNSGDAGPEIVGVRALDDTTLVVEIAHPAAYFPAIASMWVMFPQPRRAIEALMNKPLRLGLLAAAGWPAPPVGGAGWRWGWNTSRASTMSTWL